jgi:hypothetical protein
VRHPVAYLFVCCLLAMLVATAAIEADWAWLTENFRNAFDHSLPLEKGSSVLVSNRSYERLQVGEPEYSVSISERPDDSPEGSVAEAEKNLKFKDWDLSDEECPALRTMVQKLSKVRFEFSWPDKIFIDPRVHEFHFDSYSTSADFSIDPGHPLVQWAFETRHAIQACSADSLPSNKPVGSSKR